MTQSTDTHARTQRDTRVEWLDRRCQRWSRLSAQEKRKVRFPRNRLAVKIEHATFGSRILSLAHTMTLAAAPFTLCSRANAISLLWFNRHFIVAVARCAWRMAVITYFVGCISRRASSTRNHHVARCCISVFRCLFGCIFLLTNWLWFNGRACEMGTTEKRNMKT